MAANPLFQPVSRVEFYVGLGVVAGAQVAPAAVALVGGWVAWV